METRLEFNDRLLSLGLARVSEAAAIAATKFIGAGDEQAADQAAVDAMRTQLNMLDINGKVVIGEGERDEAPMLYVGEQVGSGNGPAVDIALDPLEGTNLTAKDMPNALTVIAMGPKGSLLNAPVLIVTHPSSKISLNSAIEEISKLEICINEPVVLKIEDL